jgi:hypothetical protein
MITFADASVARASRVLNFHREALFGTFARGPFCFRAAPFFSSGHPRGCGRFLFYPSPEFFKPQSS